MTKYKKYKASGIEWIGEIPNNWEITRFKYLVDRSKYYQIGDGDHGSIKPDMYQEHGIPYIRVQNLSWDGTIKYEGMVYISEEVQKANNKSRLLPNDILCAKTGATIGKLGMIPSTLLEANTTSSVGKISVNTKKYFPRYILYFLMSKYFTHQIWQDAIQKSAQPGFNIDDLIEYLITCPNLDLQIKIANYLDKKTKQIDNLIAKKERLIKLLEEEKTAVINEAVTKGINPNAKLKDSGIEWIGKIPEHWVTYRLAVIGQFSKGKGISRSDLTEEGCPAILYGDIYTKYNITADAIQNRISEATAINSIKIQNGDLMFTGSGETKEDIGKCIVYVGNEIVSVGGDVIIFRQNKFNSLFLSYSLNSNSSIYQKARTGKGEIIVHIYSSNLRDLIIPLPGIDEQIQIVNYIEKETSRIDKTIEKTKKLIVLLKEYRTALISEAVTGKIDVRDSHG